MDGRHERHEMIHPFRILPPLYFSLNKILEFHPYADQSLLAVLIHQMNGENKTRERLRLKKKKKKKRKNLLI